MLLLGEQQQSLKTMNMKYCWFDHHFIIHLPPACEWNIPDIKAIPIHASAILVRSCFFFFLITNIFIWHLKTSKYYTPLYCYEYSVTFTYGSILLSHIQSLNTAIHYFKRLNNVRFLTFITTLDWYLSRFIVRCAFRICLFHTLYTYTCIYWFKYSIAINRMTFSRSVVIMH